MLTGKLYHPRISGQFDLAPGIYAVVGLSGAGKTSWFRLLAGLDPHQSAEICVNGTSITELPAHRRPIAYVPQRPSLIPHKTIADQVHWVQQASDDEVHFWRHVLGLNELWERKPGKLSGGEQQRAALLRALAANRPILLLDEALSNVDTPHRRTIWEQLMGRWPQGHWLLYATHDWSEAELAPDGVLYIETGTLYPGMSWDALKPHTASMAYLMGCLGIVRDRLGHPYWLHPRLVQVGTSSGQGVHVDGELYITRHSPLTSHYVFSVPGQATLSWMGPPFAEGRYFGVTLQKPMQAIEEEE